LLIPSSVLELLAEAGVTVSARTASEQGDSGVELVVAAPGWSEARHLQVKRFSRPITPSVLARLAAQQGSKSDGLLIITPSATRELRKVAYDLGVSLIALNRERASGPDGHLAFSPGDVVMVGRALQFVEDRSPPPRGRKPWRTSLVLRTLILDGRRPQREIAAIAGVSQPRVSQVLNELMSGHLLERKSSLTGRWRIKDWDGLVRRWLESYPGPGGVTTFWYGLVPPMQQAISAIDLLSPLNRGAINRSALSGYSGENALTPVLVSGDLAADLLAPWARPRCAVIYARCGADLVAAGMTPSPKENATLELVVPQDPGVWALAGRVWSSSPIVPLADPLQILWDLSQSPSLDARQAAEHVLDWMRHRYDPDVVGDQNDEG